MIQQGQELHKLLIVSHTQVQFLPKVETLQIMSENRESMKINNSSTQLPDSAHVMGVVDIVAGVCQL